MALPFAFGFSGDDIDVAVDVDVDADVDADDRDREHEKQGDNGTREKKLEQPTDQTELFPPQRHTLAEILSSLPSHLSYNTLAISLDSPSSEPDRVCRTIKIPRRSLFDVVTQLKAESDIQLRPGLDSTLDPGTVTLSNRVKDSSHGDGTINPPNYDHEGLISTLESGDDLRARVYEGGFKTWECAVDLASYLASCLVMDGRVGDSDLERWLMDGGGEGEGGIFGCEDDKAESRDDYDRGFDVVELGAGSGIPSLVVLNYICRRGKKREEMEEKKRRQRLERDDSRSSSSSSSSSSSPHAQGLDGAGDGQGSIRFILCDYNIAVLRLLTGANVLLQLGQNGLLPNSGDGFCEDDAGRIGREDVDRGEGEFDLDSVASHHRPLDETVLVAVLRQIGISSIDFISGAWGEGRFVDLILPPSPPSSTNMVSNPIQGPASASASASASTPTRQKKRPVLILCSETIYSPSSLPTFTSTLLSLLRRSGDTGRSMALVAAKKIYFGIGGGVDDFTAEAQRAGAAVEVVKETAAGGRGGKGGGKGGGGKGGGGKGGGGGGGGVGRVILKVTVEKRGSYS